MVKGDSWSPFFIFVQNYIMLIGDRISTEDHSNYTTIIIYPKIESWKLILFSLWVAGFTFVGFYMIYILTGGIYSLEVIGDNVEDIRDQQLVYTIVFLGFWLYFEYKSVKQLLWFRFGKELIKLDTDMLTHKRSILGYGRAHSYFYDNMKNFALFKNDATSFGQFFENAIWSQGTDGLVFSYFNKDKSFGKRLDEKTSRLLFRFIEDKVKSLRKKKSA